MTRLEVTKATVLGGARTHALVIGVGHYRYFQGGANHDHDLPIPGSQLTSPPVSARAFTDWLLRDYNPPDAPLASVELLLSAGHGDPLETYTRSDTGAVVKIERATRPQVKDAYLRWRGEFTGDGAADHVAIFFFCGHGVRRENQLLLCEDFGERREAMFDGAFSYERTYRAMESCHAGRQFFFIDACDVELPDRVKKQMLSDEAAPLSEPKVLTHDRKASEFRASAPGRPAHGEPGQVSYFTKAVLEGLGGLGSEQDARGVWIVSAGMLYMSIAKHLRHLAESHIAPEMEPHGDVAILVPLHVVGAMPPRVPFIISFKPKKAHRRARVSMRTFLGVPIDVRPTPRRERYELELEPASHLLSAEFSEGYKSVHDVELTVTTPRGSRDLEIEEL